MQLVLASCADNSLPWFKYQWENFQSTGYSRNISSCMCAQSLSHVLLFATPWTVDHKAPLSMGLPRQEYWSGLPFPSPGDLPGPGIEPVPHGLLHWQMDSLPLSHVGSLFPVS